MSGLRSMALEERPEDKSASPFEKDLHELHEHGSLPNGLHNGQEDDKAFKCVPILLCLTILNNFRLFKIIGVETD